MFVKKELRRRGLFKAMFEFLEMKVAKGEYAGVRLYVDKDNVSAKNAYQKLGMNGHHYIVFERMK